ncbi:MAG: hypothetical protein ACOYMR_10835 [Ilumatobacteraceae bacterium]
MRFNDDDFRTAGDALDAASREHGRRPVHVTPSTPPRARWAAVAAGVVVLGVLVAAFVIGGGEPDSDRTAPATDVSSETTLTSPPNETIPGGTEVTTPMASDGDTTPTEPTQTALTAPPSTSVANPSGFRCLEPRGSLDVKGIEFSIVRVPRCSATNTVFLRMGGTSTAACSGPPSATLSDGSSLLFTTAGAPWAVDGRWRPYEPGASAADGVTAQYSSNAMLLRPIELPAGAGGELSIDFDMTCGDEQTTVHLVFALIDTPTTLPGVVRVDERAQYYGACGNETATFSGETWYPLLPQEQELVDPDLYRPPAQTSAGLRAPKVVGPGPGDDVGTFIVYDDGIGRYESDSGRVIWLTQEPHEYAWDC